MAIYQLFEEEKDIQFTETFESAASSHTKGKGGLFSTIITRFCFLLLVVADAAWLVFNTLCVALALSATILTWGKVSFFKKRLRRFALHWRRSVVCGLALLVGLFSPPFGIMVACTYFLMYDKAGMDEVVPAPLQAQFKEIFQPNR